MQPTHGGPANFCCTGRAMTDKIALRSRFRSERRAFVLTLDKPRRTALETRLADVVAPALGRPRMPGSYAAVGDEIDPWIIEQRLGPHAFPRISGSRLTFHTCRWEEMIPGFQGIPEPPPGAPQVTPDLLLVPLIAVTPAGVRLGQGRGYYDRALADLRRASGVTAIGIAWDCQVTDHLPADDWDMPLDWVATPTRLYDCRQTR